MIIFDFQCLNKECAIYQDVKEVFCDRSTDRPDCTECGQMLSKALNCAYVQVQNGTPKFRRKGK